MGWSLDGMDVGLVSFILAALCTTVSATAPPRLPMEVASSAVTMPAVSCAAATIASTSSGFTVGIESTRAEIPSPARISAATRARQITVPLLIKVTSPPWRRVTALPGTNS